MKVIEAKAEKAEGKPPPPLDLWCIVCLENNGEEWSIMNRTFKDEAGARPWATSFHKSHFPHIVHITGEGNDS